MTEPALEFPDRVLPAVGQKGEDVRFALRHAEIGQPRLEAHARHVRRPLQLDNQKRR